MAILIFLGMEDRSSKASLPQQSAFNSSFSLHMWSPPLVIKLPREGRGGGANAEGAPNDVVSFTGGAKKEMMPGIKAGTATLNTQDG